MQLKDDLVVLYLEDEIDLLEVFGIFLEDLPVKVKPFSDPEECIEYLNSTKDKIICGFFDYRLRGTTGIEVISRISDRFPSYIISGDLTIGDIHISEVKGVLSKPIDFEKVKLIVTEYLNK